jgi:hypothetical protein
MRSGVQNFSNSLARALLSSTLGVAVAVAVVVGVVAGPVGEGAALRVVGGDGLGDREFVTSGDGFSVSQGLSDSPVDGVPASGTPDSGDGLPSSEPALASVGVGSAHAGAWTKSVDAATTMERRPFFNHNFSPTENAVKV